MFGARVKNAAGRCVATTPPGTRRRALIRCSHPLTRRALGYIAIPMMGSRNTESVTPEPDDGTSVRSQRPALCVRISQNNAVDRVLFLFC
jgi:hypothetical protein